MSRLVHVGILSLLAAALCGVSGCGGADSATSQRAATVTQTVTSDPSTHAPVSPRQAASSTSSTTASSVVRAYVDAINAQDYRRAWNLGGKHLSSSYASFADGFAGTAEDVLHILRTQGDVVSVRLEATQTDGSRRVFEGTYTVRDGTIVAADMREVSGQEPSPAASSPYYANCDEARAAGAAPLHRGEPGYAPHLDRDGDGVACETYIP